MKKFVFTLVPIAFLAALALGGSGGKLKSSAIFAQANGLDRAQCGPPNYACSYDGPDPKPLCTDCALPTVPDMSAEPNAVWYDNMFGLSGKGNQIVRCTYPDMNGEGKGSFAIGFGGSGDTNAIGKAGGSPPSYRLIVWFFPFTYTPDPAHPTCHPTYKTTYRVAEGSFSWVTPHLYYAFGGSYYQVNAIDLGGPTPPPRIPIIDFQQILPRTGPDWPGANQQVALGAIIAPHGNNQGNYLYQATCTLNQKTCSIARTGAAVPSFSQTVMSDTPDGTVTWRNIGPGFNGPSPWSVVGGVSKDDDVFVKAFSDDGGQGGPGAIFVAAYKRSTNIYYFYNVGTGILSYFTCSGGSGYNCSGGSWNQTILGMTNLPDRFLLHNLKVNKSGEWVVLEQDSCRFESCSTIPGGPGIYFWHLSTATASVTKITSHPWGHFTEGFNLFANQNGESDVNLNGRSFAKPDDQFPLNYFIYNWHLRSLPRTEGLEAHPSWNYNDGSDTTPVCTATAGFDWPYVIPWENEVVCYGTNPNPDCSTAGHGLCRTQVKRFFHTFNPATCDQYDGFNSCYGIGALSQDGKYYAFTSNWGDTLGSVESGGQGPGSCVGGFNSQRNHLYEVGDVFEPSNGTGNGHPNPGFTVFRVTVSGSSSNYPNGPWPRAWMLKHDAADGFYQDGDIILPNIKRNPCNHAFQVTSGGGTANGSKLLDWQNAYGYSGSCQSVTTGQKVIDGGITWTDIGEYVLGTMHLANMGRDTCRSDVFIGELN